MKNTRTRTRRSTAQPPVPEPRRNNATVVKQCNFIRKSLLINALRKH